MILNDFIGGHDVQQSLNHSDNRCVNLYPSLNDKGDIAAFYATPGLTLEVTNPSSEVGSGIYKASNGRCFEVAGTTLYELTEASGVISTTSRGTVTAAPIYRMSDNGIELCLVNGIDGWLFTFATNALIKIKVSTAEFTVTIANPAVFTKTAHGLVAGDAIRLTTTTGEILSTSLLTAIIPATVSTPYCVKVVVAPANDFVYALCNYPMHLDMFSRNTASGAISPLTPSGINFSSIGLPTDIAITSDGAFVYVVGTLNKIKLGTVDTVSGQVTASATVVSTGTDPYDIAISPDDAHVYVTNLVDNTISQYSINGGTGELTPLSTPTIATGAHPQNIIVVNDGALSFAYCTNLNDNTISIYSRNTTTGQLTAITAVSCGGTSPTGIAVSPDHAHIYCVNYVSQTVSMFSRSLTTGLLTALGTPTIATGTGPEEITIPPDGDSVYVANTLSNTISIYVRDNSTGILAPASSPTIPTGTLPFGIASSPDGKSVYVCNSGDGTVSQYSRNSASASIGLPTGLATLTTYYVIPAGLTADAFEVSETLGGTAVSTSGQQAGVHTYTTLGYGFPEGAKTISYMNGRFVALEPNTQNFYVSEVLDGKWWDALNVQTVDSNPDYVVGEIVSHNELIVFCTDSGEIFYDSGTTPSPFVRNTSGIFEVGCVAPYSICNLDNQVFWLGGNKNGQGIVYKLQGFTPMRVSTHSIEHAIQSMSDISDARAFSYQEGGHHFYVLSFPTGNRTFCFDVNTGLWHERANFSAGEFSRWEAQEHAYFAGKHLVLDHTEGKIYSIDQDAHTYGTEVKKWVRSFKVKSGNMNRQRHSRLQLDCEVGVGLVGGVEPMVMLRWSDDGGHTWSGEKWRSIGLVGEYSKPVIWHQLGITSGQPRIYELSGTSAVKIALLAVHLD